MSFFGGRWDGCSLRQASLIALHMEPVGGIELLHRLRSRGVSSTVVIISSRDDDRQEDVLATGAAAYLKTPFTNAELIAVAREVTKAHAVE